MKTTIITMMAAVALPVAVMAQTGNTQSGNSQNPSGNQNQTTSGAQRGGTQGTTGVATQNGTTDNPQGASTIGTQGNQNTAIQGDTRQSSSMNDRTTAAGRRQTENGTIGGISRAEFDRRNEEGNRMVAAIKPTETKLSAADQKLMMEVAMGGMMQLMVSQAALEKLTNEDARMLAQSEVEEQTGVSNKLKEIASAKGMTMPSEPDPATRAMIDRMNSMSGEELNMFYVRESGVKGHQKLESTMTKVKSNAKDPAMKALATATLPVIRMHMNVSQKSLSMGKSGRNTAGTK